MKFGLKPERKINWLQAVIIFMVGALVISNVFLFLNNLALQQEVQKLKADDIAIAQAINNLLNQVKSK